MRRRLGRAILIMRGETVRRALVPSEVRGSRCASAWARRGLAHTGHAGERIGMQLACHGDMPFQTTTAPRRAYACEEPGYETARRSDTVFCQYPGRGGGDTVPPVLGQTGGQCR